jgi:glycosyltransferase involved in cell wall biosynthesis
MPSKSRVFEAETKRSTVSVVVPVFNNASTVRELVNRLVVVLGGMPVEWQIVLIDDGSVDLSWDIIVSLAQIESNVQGVRLSRNFGQHPAIRAGLERAVGDYVILMDADFNDIPEEIPAMIDSLECGFDLVLTRMASRFHRPRGRFSTSRAFHFVFAKVSGTNDYSGVGTLRAFSRRFVNGMLMYGERRVVYGPLSMQLGFRRTVIERSFPSEDLSPHSSYTFSSRLSLALDALLGYTALPYQFLIALGGSISTGAALYFLAIVVGYFFGLRLPSSGATIVLLVNLMIGGAILAGLGLLGSYVFRIYGEVLGRPMFIVMEDTVEL